MKYLLLLFLFVISSLAIIGCGGALGGSSAIPGEVSGVVTDLNGNIVRGARVWAGSQETMSNSAGIYVLEDIPEGNVIIRAEISRDGVEFEGQNACTVFAVERTKSVNITLVRTDQTARIHGTVRNSFGQVISGAKVFAFWQGLGSQVAFTDSSGNYTLKMMGTGITYDLTASALGYNNDLNNVTLDPNEDARVDFSLSNLTDPAMPAPENLVAVAWTSPYEPTRSALGSDPYEAIKQMLDPRRKTRKAATRTTFFGNHVEVDLYWDYLPTSYDDNLLGYGIYRSQTSNGASVGVDFLRDPKTYFYSDIDDILLEDRNYYYEITAIGTAYPNTSNSESNFSNRYGVRTLADMIVEDTVDQSGVNPIFGWQDLLGADTYKVFVFSSYPGIGVSSIWNNSANPTTNTSIQYAGPALQTGKTYYFIVLAEANGGDSKSLSELKSFVYDPN